MTKIAKETAPKSTHRPAPVVRIQKLSIALPSGADRPYAVDRVDFDLVPGKILCVVGESGSGKSMSANAMMGLLPQGLEASGQILFEGKDLLELSENELRALRGRRIAMIFQEPMSALNPLMTVENQIAEVFEAHGSLTKAERKARARELLAEVGLTDPARAALSYPFQLSGGQRQRVVIAMALALEPQVLIADEPTTALDVTTQAQILKLVRDLQVRRNMAVMFITHDFGVVDEIADEVAVMQFGRIVESGPARSVLRNPQHEYTRKLIAAIPRQSRGRAQLADTNTILEAESLRLTYASTKGSAAKEVKAVDNVTFSVSRGETLGIVGESGSGKSSLGRCLVRLQTPQSGRILFNGVDFGSANGADLMRQRRRVQMIFQDPYGSLNPRIKVGRTIADGPIAYGEDKKSAMDRARGLLERVGLGAAAADRFPHEFSGGQRQRIGIARALALEPEIIVADEAVSALDVSIQAQVLELLASLKRDLGLTLIFITHDLRVAAQICDRVMVMQKGRVVEIGPGEDIFSNPREAYTRSLIEAIPGRREAAA